MDSRVERHTDGAQHIESRCCIIHKGREFCSGGSWMMRRKSSGLMEGVLYHYKTKDNGRVRHEVGTWDGDVKVPALLLRRWRSNWGDERQAFAFTWNGRRFWGVNAGDNEIVRCREYKNQ